MTLRETIENDIGAFLNVDEFAEEHEIDGESITCLVDSDSKEQVAGTDTDAMFASLVNLYARASDLEGLTQGLPKAGRTLTLDGRKYMVVNCAEEMGITRVALTLVQS